MPYAIRINQNPEKSSGLACHTVWSCYTQQRSSITALQGALPSLCVGIFMLFYEYFFSFRFCLLAFWCCNCLISYYYFILKTPILFQCLFFIIITLKEHFASTFQAHIFQLPGQNSLFNKSLLITIFQFAVYTVHIFTMFQNSLSSMMIASFTMPFNCWEISLSG